MSVKACMKASNDRQHLTKKEKNYVPKSNIITYYRMLHKLHNNSNKDHDSKVNLLSLEEKDEKTETHHKRDSKVSFLAFFTPRPGCMGVLNSL